MKKLIIFLVTIFIFLLSITIYLYRDKSYSLEYNIDNYEITESFNKDNLYYTYNVKFNDKQYDFAFKHKYTTKRKLVESINYNTTDSSTCLSLNVFSSTTDTVCNDGNSYLSPYLAGFNSEESNNKVDEVNNVSIYDNTKTYLIWNGFGFNNLLTGDTLNVLSNEKYDNSLSYEIGNYLIIPDYDQTRTFNKFYIYDSTSNKFNEWKINYDISFESYFLGAIGDYVYLLDKTNSVEYKLNISKKKIEKVDKGEMATFYDKGETTILLSKLVHNTITFNYNNLYNFSLIDNTLFMNYYNSSNKIKISNKKVNDIVEVEDSTIYYIVGDSLYSYNANLGEKQLLTYFEWNFSYLNKIYIFG
ncbi:MAG TPA: hypothetical protein PKG93_01240 [Bacilli bacterium]|jgi:hypothetical protein|nr:hypothetical protein [Bacilli bacterium]HPZ24077.1 hypothetical protein [Bacilli bacterium]